MTKTARQAAGVAVVVAVLGWTSRAAASQDLDAAVTPPSVNVSHARVRGVGPRFVAVISEAADRSATFRGLVDRIGHTDGIVYVAEGQCGHGVWACLLPTMTMAGPNRVLRILVDPGKVDRDLMGSMGHELQHAVEVLGDRTIRDHGAMVLLFKQMCAGCLFRFETDAAIRAGDAVRDELQKSAAAWERRE
jgi:hypothetical protein